MRYQISELRLSPQQYADRDHLTAHLERALRRKLGRKGRRMQLKDLEILRESIDARKKPAVQAVYTVSFETDRILPLAQAKAQHPLTVPECGRDRIVRPVIAGFGPCGIFAALTLAKAGLKPIVLERGQPVAQRMRDVARFWQEGVLDPNSNVQFGEGGAGTFSDGKLTTGIRDPRIRSVLETFVQAGAREDILYQQKPHIGTDQLQLMIPRIREEILRLGGDIRFGSQLVALEQAEGRLAACRTADGTRIATDALILAVGHSARDTFRMLQEAGIAMERKPFSIGLRIEHPQQMIDAAQYGDGTLAEIFGPASYKLHHRCENGRGVYTFCMCPGGQVINAASEDGGAVTNGMSLSARDSGTANAGLLVDVRPSDFPGEDPLVGVAFQQYYERKAFEAGRAYPGGLPSSTYGSFRQDPGDVVRQCLPAFAGEAICEAMPHLGRKLRGFDRADARLTAVETRSSSPVRIIRDASMQSSLPGLIPAGEGPGYAGGIMSAAVDGIRAAQQVIQGIIEQGKQQIGE